MTDRGRFTLTPEQLRAHVEFHEAVPGWKVRDDLLATYAHERGGLTLAFLRLYQGPAFREPALWSLEACAEELDVPLTKLWEILLETYAWVDPRVLADPEWQRLAAMDELELWEEVERCTGKLGPPPPEIRAQAGKPRFMYIHFSDEANEAIGNATRLAMAQRAEAVLPQHLEAALDPKFDAPEVTTEDWIENRVDYSRETAIVVRRAHDDAQAEGRLVAMDDLRQALAR